MGEENHWKNILEWLYLSVEPEKRGSSQGRRGEEGLSNLDEASFAMAQ